MFCNFVFNITRLLVDTFCNIGSSNSGRGPLFVLEIRGETDQLNTNKIKFLKIY